MCDSVTSWDTTCSILLHLPHVLIPDDGNSAPCLHHLQPELYPTPRCRHQAASRAPRFFGAGSDMPHTSRDHVSAQLRMSGPSLQPSMGSELSQPLALSWDFETVPCRACSSVVEKLGVHHAGPGSRQALTANVDRDPAAVTVLIQTNFLLLAGNLPSCLSLPPATGIIHAVAQNRLAAD